MPDTAPDRRPQDPEQYFAKVVSAELEGYFRQRIPGNPLAFARDTIESRLTALNQERAAYAEATPAERLSRYPLTTRQNWVRREAAVGTDLSISDLMATTYFFRRAEGDNHQNALNETMGCALKEARELFGDPAQADRWTLAQSLIKALASSLNQQPAWERKNPVPVEQSQKK